MTLEAQAKIGLLQSAFTKILTLSALSLLPAIALLVACFPLLSRSLWCDEVMLFSNYPIHSLKEIFSPLPYYDQAATPFYNLWASLIVSFNPKLARAASVLVASFTCAAILIYSREKLISVIAVFLAFTFSIHPLIMFSELKHYGFEVLGALVAIAWFVQRDRGTGLRARDAVVLIGAMLLGISTLVVVIICALLFFLERVKSGGPLMGSDLKILVVIIAAAGLYYLCIRYDTAIQMENYPYAYATVASIENAKVIIQNIYLLLGKWGAVAAFCCLILLTACLSHAYAYRLLLLLTFTGIAVLMAAIIGLYPVRFPRHVFWITAFFAALMFFSLYVAFTADRVRRIAAIALALGLAAISFKIMQVFWSTNFEHTANRQAVSFLESLPPSMVGVWMWGQPVIDYYSKHSTGLQKHKFFGAVNPATGSAELPKDLSLADLEWIESAREKTGAWGRMHVGLVTKKFKMPARSLVSAAPRDEVFYLFASHLNPEWDGWGEAALRDLEFALDKAGCRFKSIWKFRNAYVYECMCPR